MKNYDHKRIEKKWQKYWAKKKIYRTEDFKNKKFYVLDMFPYPSGEGLHVGHPKGYIATDIISRFHRMNGYNVLHPMGFDAFGLPAENYAIKNKVHPEKAVKKNIKRYKEQLEKIGFDYDWDREVNTTDPKYYKWTQWIFLKMFERGLAYESHEPINWCPSCKTGLANEDVEDGLCERCGSVVEKKPMRQWVLKITDYADRLLSDLDKTAYEMPKLIDDKNPHQDGKPLVKRYVAHAIVFDPKKRKYLIIRNKKFGWDTVIIGGIEDGEDPVKTAIREVEEETGYVDIEFKRLLGGQTEAHYYTKHKGENRIAIAQAVYFELKSDKRVPIADGEDKDNEILWVDESDFVPGKMVNSELPLWLERIKDSKKGYEEPVLDWPESIKESQRNWIGRSEGAEIKFEIRSTKSEKNLNQKIKNHKLEIEVFTTRPDTLFGATYLVIAPEHEFVREQITNSKSQVTNKSEIEKYLNAAKKKTEMERTAEGKEKTGVELKGIKAINPANGEEIPIWVADYVLADYGTGAIMAVPAHDERDFEFAGKFMLPIRRVVEPPVALKSDCFTGTGTLINSGQFDGVDSDEAKRKITEFVKGKWVTKYKLRDWVFSRQRYWGEPIPLIHCEKCGVVAVPEKDLPVELPKVKYYEPTGTGESPLAAISKWVNVKCPKCKGNAKRETNTMPQWAGSSWYYLRYMDPDNKKQLVNSGKEKYWAPVDWYVGGAEHATRHLIYARFWHKFLFDIGVVSTEEPFRKLQNVGLIQAPDGRKMSKRFGNVINPDDIIETYGADTLRVYEMFMGPFDREIAWSTKNMIGTRRFIEKVWRLQEKIHDPRFRIQEGKPKKEKNTTSNSKLETLMHQTIKKVTEDIRAMRFNTAVSQLMILTNEMEKEENISPEDYKTVLLLLAPFAPHVAEELWSNFEKTSIHLEPWPKYDPRKVVEDMSKIIIQVNGKVRGSLDAPRGAGEEDIARMVYSVPEIKKWIEGRPVKRVIFVKDKLLNFVV